MSETKVLIVDDDGPILKALSFRFQHAGFDVFCAKDGISALSIVAAEQPSIAILDINLPGVDGFSLADKIRGVADQQLPILFMSASKSNDVLLHPAIQDVGTFYAKPFDAKELVSDVMALLSDSDQLLTASS